MGEQTDERTAKTNFIGEGEIRKVLLNHSKRTGKKQAGFLAIGRQGLFLIAAILALPVIFSQNIDSLALFTNILPYKLQPGLYGVLYSQFAADALGTILTIIFAVHLKKELAGKLAE